MAQLRVEFRRRLHSLPGSHPYPQAGKQQQTDQGNQDKGDEQFHQGETAVA